MSSSMPHLQALHCRIWFVVPVKLPLILELIEVGMPRIPTLAPGVWFAVLLSGRGSQSEDVTFPAQ